MSDFKIGIIILTEEILFDCMFAFSFCLLKDNVWEISEDSYSGDFLGFSF